MNEMFVIFTVDYWKTMGFALLRTLIAGLVPFATAYSAGVPVDFVQTALTIALLLVVTILSSFRGVPIPQEAPFFEVVLARFLRQFAQFTIAGIGTAVLITEVDWKTLLLGALASAVATALIAALTVIPGQQAPTTEIVVNVAPTDLNPTAVPGDGELAAAMPEGDRYI